MSLLPHLWILTLTSAKLQLEGFGATPNEDGSLLDFTQPSDLAAWLAAQEQ